MIQDTVLIDRWPVEREETATSAPTRKFTQRIIGVKNREIAY